MGEYLGLVLAGYAESLNTDDEIVVPDDDYGLQAIDILDPSLVSSLFSCFSPSFFRDSFDCFESLAVSMIPESQSESAVEQT